MSDKLKTSTDVSSTEISTTKTSSTEKYSITLPAYTVQSNLSWGSIPHTKHSFVHNTQCETPGCKEERQRKGMFCIICDPDGSFCSFGPWSKGWNSQNDN